MILPRYHPNFAQLDEHCTDHLLGAMIARYPEITEMPRTATPLEIANHLNLDQADVVMCLASDPTALGVHTAELLVGRPFVRARRATEPSRINNRTPRSTPTQRPTPRKSDPRVVLTVQPNPKAPTSKSWQRYELWRVGMTVSEAIAAGLTTGDVAWDTGRGFVLVGDPDSPASRAARSLWLSPDKKTDGD